MKSLWSILVRELLQQSRQAGSYWLRVLGAGMLVGITVLIWMTEGMAVNRGNKIFEVFHLFLFGAIWIVVPFMVSDSLSRERREGTLGLLFLTPLRPIQIVIAKCVAHALRGLTFLIACLPVLALTILQGGVSWQQVTISLALMGGAFCWALGAGLLASSQCKSMQRSLGVATGWACLGFFMMTLINGWLLFHLTRYFRGNGHPSWTGLWELGIYWILEPEYLLRYRSSRNWISATVLGQPNWMFQFNILMLVLSLCGLLIAIMLAARGIKKRWQEEPPSAARQKMQNTFCRPRVATGLYRWWLTRKLNRNPVGWLDQRTWQSRLIMWTWLAILVFIYSTILASGTGFIRGFDTWQRALSLLLLLTLAATSAGSFHRERESGVLELLLVSPLSLKSILWGRLRGLWGQFVLALLLVVVVWIHMTLAVGDIFLRYSPHRFEYMRCANLVLAFFCVPMVGLYFSLRLKNYLSAFAWTLLTSLVLPIFVALVGANITHTSPLLRRYGETGDVWTYTLISMIFPALLLIAIAGAAILGILNSLRSRRFVLQS